MLSNPLRYAFDEASKAATQFSVGDPGKAPVPEDEEPGLEGRDFYSPERATFASGMHAVIVETDPETAEIKILKYAVVHDCGNLINPMIVEGQIHGGVAQGVGGALYERMAYDESGQLLNASFMDFLMPYVTEVPDGIDIDHLETPSPLNPLGIKGAGEAGVIPSAAVFAAAIEDAERTDLPGFGITAMPISPSELFALRQAPATGALVMKISGSNVVAQPVDKVWEALLDPRVLVATIPGCERLEETGDHQYAMTVTAGVAAIRGTYNGSCSLSDLQERESLVMTLQGAGAPGTVDATVHVRVLRAGAGPDRDRLRRRRGRRRDGRRRRPADAGLGVEADGRRVLRQRRHTRSRPRRRSSPSRPAQPGRAGVFTAPAKARRHLVAGRLRQGHRRRCRAGAARCRRRLDLRAPAVSGRGQIPRSAGELALVGGCNPRQETDSPDQYVGRGAWLTSRSRARRASRSPPYVARRSPRASCSTCT